MTAPPTCAGTQCGSPPLTAPFQPIPQSHDGSSEFVFRLDFSEDLHRNYRTLRDSAFDVPGGTVINASRVNRSSDMQWEIRTRPDSDEAVTVALPATHSCRDAGGIRSTDGRDSSGPTTANIPGPGGGLHHRRTLQSFEGPRDAFHPFHNPVGGRPHQGNAEVTLSAFAKADAGGHHHSLPFHQQLRHLRG